MTKITCSMTKEELHHFHLVNILTAYAPVRDSGFRIQDSFQDSGFISGFRVFPDSITGYHLFKTYQ